MFPQRITVGVHTYSEGPKDRHQNVTPVYTPPLDQPGAPRRAYGIQPAGTTEPKIAGHDRVTVDLELLVPPGFPVGPRDVIDLPAGPAGAYEVIGYPEDYTLGPWPYEPGYVVNLRRTES